MPDTLLDQEFDLTGCKARLMSYDTNAHSVRLSLNVLPNQELYDLVKSMMDSVHLPHGSVGRVLGGQEVTLTIVAGVQQIRSVRGWEAM